MREAAATAPAPAAFSGGGACEAEDPVEVVMGDSRASAAPAAEEEGCAVSSAAAGGAEPAESAASAAAAEL